MKIFQTLVRYLVTQETYKNSGAIETAELPGEVIFSELLNITNKIYTVAMLA